MSNTLLSTQFKSIVEPILNKPFDGIMDQRKDEWKAIFEQVDGTPRAYHEVPVLFGMGTAPELPDGTPVTYDGGGVLYIKRYLYKRYGLAYSISKTLMEDGDHIHIGKIFSKQLAMSLIETKETLTANVLNRAFNSSYPGGDGVSLISTAHPLATGGTYSNQLTTAAALSQTSLEQLLIQIYNAVDANGKKINLRPKKLVVSPSNVFQAQRLLKSVLQTGTANNDINAVKSSGMLSEDDSAVISRVTSTTAWWVSTNADEGLQLVMRTPLERSMEGDFETDSMRYKAVERYDVGWVNPRALFGTSGL